MIINEKKDAFLNELGLLAIASAKYAKEHDTPLAEAVKQILKSILDDLQKVDRKIIEKTLSK